MTDKDLGSVVALWQVSVGAEGKVFDLVDLEASAGAVVAKGGTSLCAKLTLDAFRLPENAYVLILFPEGEEAADAGAEVSSPSGDEPG